MLLTDVERLQYRSEPTPETIKAAWNTIHGHEAAISDIEDRIHDLLNQVQHLRYDQAKHRAAIERCIGLVTLARRLPEELLIKIFEHCVEDGWTRAPIVVSHVCSAWRRAAHAPKVWSHVYAKCDDPQVLDRTRFWLQMARGAYLHVTVVTSWRVPPRPIMEVMALLLERSAQWKSLKIETDSMRHADLILAQCNSPVPELREVDIRTAALDVGDPEGVSDLVRLADRFNTSFAPRLATVSYVSTVVPAVPIFPSHITNLTLEVKESPSNRPLSASAMIGILESLTELRSLSLSMPLIYEHEFIPEQDSERVASLPSLTALTVYGPTDLNELLPHIHAPSLRRLCLRSLEDLGLRQRPIGPSFTRFIGSSFPPLELLELHDIDLDPETFETCFAALPHLRELRLHESSISDATVQLLNGPRGLCPRLKRLDLRWCGHLRGRALVDLVRSRHVVDDLAGPVSDPIEEIGVINCCFVAQEDVLDLARMTVCRLVTRETDDYCRTTLCCTNQRYRTRLRMRHVSEFLDRNAGIRLVL
ncbi:hypothetical protein BV20DRAFT_1045441 [Pilatotrama ljubarskyi]|nr:hypothetical protein BV20DRAFT_1045441 [Pilatotrama ljubarskyi]